MIEQKILEKLELDPEKSLAKAIRGYSGFTTKDLITALINTESISEASVYLGYTSDTTIKRAIKEVLQPKFPERTGGLGSGKKFASWRFTLLAYVEHKHCCTCSSILPFSFFGSHKGNDSTGLAGQCLSCKVFLSKQNKQEIIKRTPIWANLEKIRDFYNNCPEGFHVDHIIPLRGVNVSGLHVEANLQYLWASDNISKSNTYIIE